MDGRTLGLEWQECNGTQPLQGYSIESGPNAQELTGLGFADIKVLYIADNFGADWADKGYPVAHG